MLQLSPRGGPGSVRMDQYPGLPRLAATLYGVPFRPLFIRGPAVRKLGVRFPFGALSPRHCLMPDARSFGMVPKAFALIVPTGGDGCPQPRLLAAWAGIQRGWSRRFASPALVGFGGWCLAVRPWSEETLLL